MKFSFSRVRPRSCRDGERSATAKYIKLAIKTGEDNRNKAVAMANQRRPVPRIQPRIHVRWREGRGKSGIARDARRNTRVAEVNSRVNRAKH